MKRFAVLFAVAAFAGSPAAPMAQIVPAATSAPAFVLTPSPMSTPTTTPLMPIVRQGSSNPNSALLGPVFPAPMPGFRPTLTIQGTASVVRKPDRATATIGIFATADEPDAALALLSPRVASFLRTVDRLHGVRASEFASSVNGFAYNSSSPTTFNAETQFAVSIDDLSSLPAVRNAVAAAGNGNPINLRYDTLDRPAAANQALTAAIADATRQADAIAAKSSLRLGRRRQMVATLVDSVGDDAANARVDATATVTYEISTL